MGGEQPQGSEERAIALDVPETYRSWIVDVLREGDASGMVPDLRYMLQDFDRYNGDPLVREVGIETYLQAIIDSLRGELAERTRETVAELNLALERYTTELPETYVQTEENGPWQLVEGFVEGEDFTVLPVLEAQPWYGAIIDIQQREDEPHE